MHRLPKTALRAAWMRPLPTGFALLCLITLRLVVPTASGQIPDELTNLKHLDAGIEKAELVGIMRDWSTSLGVRCRHCHVGPDNLQGMDFASDEKATKKTAREMLEMARKINGELLAGLPIVAAEGREHSRQITCYTCHRGLSTPPREIQTEIGEVIRKDGVAAALEHYEELREEHAGSGRYDFRPAALFHLARDLMQGGQPETAREILKGLDDIHPDFADGFALLAQIEAQLGNVDAAQTALERALAIDPDNRMANWLKSRMPKAEDGGESGE